MRRTFLLLALLMWLGFSSQSSSALAASVTRTQPVRAVHIVLRSLTVADVKRLIDMATVSDFNTFIVDLCDQIKFKNFPGEVLENAWSPEAFAAVVAYARKQGLDVIPEIKFLTHQEFFLGRHRPDLMFNTTTYDPRKPEVYRLVFSYLDEIIDLLHPNSILIGHDEVAGHNEKSRKMWLAADEPMLPADLFLEDVSRIHAYLAKRGVTTWMWGDMLIAPEEFPSMLPMHLHGAAPGYGRAMRKKLPKDIVICDWHYYGRESDFSSLKAFKEDGFRMLGATWRKSETTRNFSRYAARYGADGMIATTWFFPEAKHDRVVNSWDEVNKVIRESGEAFRKDFPDAR